MLGKGRLWAEVEGYEWWSRRESQVVLGSWVLQKVSEMERNQIGQFVNLTDIVGIVGLNHRYLFCFNCYLTEPDLPWALR